MLCHIIRVWAPSGHWRQQSAAAALGTAPVAARCSAWFKFGSNGMDSTGAGIYGSQTRDDFDRDDVEQVRIWGRRSLHCIPAHAPVCPISESTGMLVKGCDLCTQPQTHVHSYSCSRNDRMYKVIDISISIVYARLFPQHNTQNTKHKTLFCRFVTQMVEVPNFASKSWTKY